MIRLSIILPVFNGGPTLQRCISSVRDQQLTDFELIIINDGSTDNTADIIHKSSLEDPRIKFFNIDNSGVSNARNIGLKNATGKYLGFIDADDWIENDFFEELVTQADNTNADWVIADVHVIEQGKPVKKRLGLKDEVMVISDRKKILQNLLDFRYDYSNWNKLYKLSIVRENGILFSEELGVWEDLLFNLCYFDFVHSIVTTSNCSYNYLVHPGSVMRSPEKIFSHDYNHLYSAYLRFSEKSGIINNDDTIATFKKDRAITAIGTIQNFVRPQNFTFRNIVVYYRRLKVEFRFLNRNIYVDEVAIPGINRIIFFFLKHRLLNLFALTEVSRSVISNLLHKKNNDKQLKQAI